MQEPSRRKLLIWDWARRGGGPLMTLLLARHLIDLGYKGDIALSLSAQNELIDEFRGLGVPLALVETFAEKPSVARLLWRSAALSRSLRQHLSSHDPETVLIPMLFGASAPLALLARAKAKRLVYVVHDASSHEGDTAKALKDLAQVWLARLADHLVFPSEATKNRYMGARSFRGQSAVQPLAGLYVKAKNAREFPTDRPIRLLMPGRLVRYKGFDRIAAAAGLLGSRSCTITVSGKGPDAGRIRQLFADVPNVSVHIEWTSAEDRRRLFDTHDVLLCPHDDASQSGLICEALCEAMPAIVTPVGALPEQIGFGKAGWVTRDMSPEALADCIVQSASPENYRQASAGCGEVLEQARRAMDWPNILALEGRP